MHDIFARAGACLVRGIRACSIGMPANDQRLADLRAAYQAGNLVVFAGEGISAAAGVPTWRQLAVALRDRLRAEGKPVEVVAEVDDFLETGRLVDALSAVKLALGTPEFEIAVERACDDQGREVPDAARAIASIRPRLRAVITTNLDHFLERAFASEWPALARATGDIASRRCYILKLHGTLLDRRTWVFSREGYDRLPFGSPEARGAFEALFRSCPILFVGSSLADDDLEQTFAAMRAVSGDQPPMHFALVPKGVTSYRRGLLERAGLRLVEYEHADGEHLAVPALIRSLDRDPGEGSKLGVPVPVVKHTPGTARSAPHKIGTYEIVRPLARSDTGGVYLARCGARGVEVALKVMLARAAMNAAARGAFLREVEVIRGLRHRNIVNLIEHGTGEDGFWFAMELCHGGNVEQLVWRRGGRIPVREGVALVLEALEGLEVAHVHGLVHRDLEPTNLLFEQPDGGPLKIANFGFAKSFLAAGGSGFSVTGAAAPGTPEFMPREQVVNFKYARPPSDVWSMAAILYFMLTGRVPRDADPTQDPLTVVLTYPVVPIRQRIQSIPPRLAEVIDVCLSLDVATRPVDAADMKRRILAAL